MKEEALVQLPDVPPPNPESASKARAEDRVRLGVLQCAVTLIAEIHRSSDAPPKYATTDGLLPHDREIRAAIIVSLSMQVQLSCLCSKPSGRDLALTLERPGNFDSEPRNTRPDNLLQTFGKQHESLPRLSILNLSSTQAIAMSNRQGPHPFQLYVNCGYSCHWKIPTPSSGTC
jgi:hypothetical protein